MSRFSQVHVDISGALDKEDKGIGVAYGEQSPGQGSAKDHAETYTRKAQNPRLLKTDTVSTLLHGH